MKTRISIKKYFVTILSFCLLTNYSYSQFSVKIINENFTGNSMGWEIRQDEFSEMNLSGGKYSLSNKSEGMAITSTIELPHLQDKNYRISAKLSKIKGIDNNGFGLVWGSTDANNEFEFVISGNGHFKVLKWEQGKKTDLIDWTYHSAVNKWDFSNNEIAVENSEGLFRFYINGAYVALLKAQELFGKKTGFVLNENMIVEVDEFIVENLMPSVFEEQISSNADISINSFKLIGQSGVNIVSTDEFAKFEILVENKSNYPAKDLQLTLLPEKSTDGFLYNQLSMIDVLLPADQKTITLTLAVDENMNTQYEDFTLKLLDKNGQVIDSKTIKLEISKSSVVYNQDSNTDDNNADYLNPYYQQDNEMESCSSGCIGTGLISIITAIILALLE